MTLTTESLKEFFDRYETLFNEGVNGRLDIDALTACFAASFVASDPNTVIKGDNNEELKAIIPQAYENYRSIGAKGVSILSLDLTLLDDNHAVARVGYEMAFERPGMDRLELPFEVIYILRQGESGPVIFAWMSGDEQALLRQHGLLPG